MRRTISMPATDTAAPFSDNATELSSTAKPAHPVSAADDLVVDMLSQDVAKWPSALFACLVDRAQDAMHGSKADLQRLSAVLRQGQDGAWRRTSMALRQALLRGLKEEDANDDVRAAYNLGMLSFAAMLIGTTASRRADDDFFEVLASDRHANLVRAMGDEELGLATLAASAELDEPAAKLRLRELMQKGAVDFRRWGGETRYFLTHAGRSALATLL